MGIGVIDWSIKGLEGWVKCEILRLLWSELWGIGECRGLKRGILIGWISE